MNRGTPFSKGDFNWIPAFARLRNGQAGMTLITHFHSIFTMSGILHFVQDNS
jgi:hypothetical protein